MGRTGPDDLGALIDSALRDEPVRQAPAQLHGSVMARVRYSAMLARERHAFFGAAMACVGCGVVLLVAAVLFLQTGLAPHLADRMPGLTGYLDYIRATYLNLSVSSLLAGHSSSVYTMISGGVAVAMAGVATRRLVRI